jgi:hypothetical protein
VVEGAYYCVLLVGPGAEEMDLHDLVLWNSFSPYVTVTEFTMLKSKRMSYRDRHRNVHNGNYLFTLDWHHPEDNVTYAGMGAKSRPAQVRSCHRARQRELCDPAQQPGARLRPVVH